MGRGLRNGRGGARDLIEVAAVLAVLATAVSGAAGDTHGAVHTTALLALAVLCLVAVGLLLRGRRR